MGNIEPWVVWLILTAVLVIGEIVVSGSFILFFGLGAIPAAAVAYFHGPLYMQFLVFIMASGMLILSCRRIMLRLTANDKDDEEDGA